MKKIGPATAALLVLIAFPSVWLLFHLLIEVMYLLASGRFGVEKEWSHFIRLTVDMYVAYFLWCALPMVLLFVCRGASWVEIILIGAICGGGLAGYLRAWDLVFIVPGALLGLIVGFICWWIVKNCLLD